MEAYEQLWNEAKQDPIAFWERLAKEELHWFEPFSQTLEWDEPFAKWFVGGKTNASYNCLDKHIAEGRGDQVAIIWEGEPGDQKTYTYQELHTEVCKFANAMKGLGIGVGDVVSIYMPMVPELVIAMLACARIGAPHSVIFAGFSAEAIADRNHDAQRLLGQRPVDDLLSDQLLVRDDQLSTIPVDHRGRPGVQLGDATGDITDGDDVADPDRTLDQEDHPARQVGNDLL